MATMGIDGLISGLDTTTLINNLMAAEAAPQSLLKTKQTETTSLVSGLQSLNTKVASLTAAATTAATPSSWAAVKATSSATSVSVVASSAAAASSLSFTVDQTASAQTLVSARISDLAQLFGGSVPSSVTLASGSGATATATTVDLTGVSDLAGFAAAVTKSGTGITATIVTVSGTESRLQLTATATGTAAAFDLYSGTVAASAVQAGTAPAPLLARADAITAAQDAKITLWAGTTASQVVTSGSNTFTGILTGVDLTVSARETSAVTVTAARDNAALMKLASGLVGSLGVVLSEIASRTATTTTTASHGGSVISGGLFSGDSAVRSLSQQLQSAASYAVDGISPSEVGIVIGRDGTFTFDDAKFTAALSADPMRVQKIVAGVANRVADVAKSTSDPIDGSLTLKITSQQGVVTDLGQQIDDWDRRLALRKEGLQATYSALEVTLSGLKAQSSWLTAQLASLGTGTSTTGG